MISDDAAYDALRARDPRFDGLFFTGVLTTGIYCRPVCPARTPKRENCRFFPSAGAAEKSGFRPCLRCRPELAPGHAPIDQPGRIAQLVAGFLHDELADGSPGLESLADRFGITSRHLRRIVRDQLGASPIELIQTQRLLLAKQLLTETTLPVTEIAFASGFSSLRRFNDAFAARHRMPPTRLRTLARSAAASAQSETSILRLTYRPPYDWENLLSFLRLRAIPGIERVTETSYARTVRIGNHTGWIHLRHLPEKSSLAVEFTHTLLPVLPTLLSKIRHQFDLTARPDVIAFHLSKDKLLRPLLEARPGLRVPGAFDGFEAAVRAILGQQVTVKAATTLARRFAEAFGEPFPTTQPGLSLLTPASEKIARATPDDIARLGIISARARGLISLAGQHAAGNLALEPGNDPAPVIAGLTAIPGIGEWTARYIALRALHWPDAFPKEDIVLRKVLGNLTAAQAEKRSAPWHPWRSYAVLHLWTASSELLRDS